MSLEALPFVLPRSLEEALRAAYAEPPRAYHSFAHVEEVLGHFASAVRWARPEEVALAILFHDAIYFLGHKDNEARSAELARALIPLHLPDLLPDLEAGLDRVAELILLTERHGSLSPAEVDEEAALFLDCDMAILGAEPARYAAYEDAIAREYAEVPRPLYREGRARFLESLLGAPRIYLSPYFRERLEERARKNLEGALVSLRTP